MKKQNDITIIQCGYCEGTGVVGGGAARYNQDRSPHDYRIGLAICSSCGGSGTITFKPDPAIHKLTKQLRKLLKKSND